MLNKMLLQITFASLVTASAIATAATTEPLKMEVYNPGEKSIFPVSSEIISGKNEVVLIDAQFQRNDAEALVKKSNKAVKNNHHLYQSGRPRFLLWFGCHR